MLGYNGTRPKTRNSSLTNSRYFTSPRRGPSKTSRKHRRRQKTSEEWEKEREKEREKEKNKKKRGARLRMEGMQAGR